MEVMVEAVKRLCGSNLSTDRLLADPLIQLVMQADRVNPGELGNLLRTLHARHGPSRESGIPSADNTYRSGVGVMLLNRQGQVFVGRRLRDPGDGWQMPQGGIEPGETPLDAALRELREEVGTNNVEQLAETAGWLSYDLPPDLIGHVWQGRWRGQRQKWFAMGFLGRDQDIRIATEHPEFSSWRWADPAELPTTHCFVQATALHRHSPGVMRGDAILDTEKSAMTQELHLERIYERVQLTRGMGDRARGRLCVMSFVAWLAGEAHTDYPTTASVVITRYAILINDAMPAGMRERLKPFAPRIIGTRDGHDRLRVEMMIEFFRSDFMPLVMKDFGSFFWRPGLRPTMCLPARLDVLNEALDRIIEAVRTRDDEAVLHDAAAVIGRLFAYCGARASSASKRDSYWIAAIGLLDRLCDLRAADCQYPSLQRLSAINELLQPRKPPTFQVHVLQRVRNLMPDFGW